MVGGDDGVHRADVHVVGVEGITCLNEILNECLETEEEDGEALDVRETVEETVHLVF